MKESCNSSKKPIAFKEYLKSSSFLKMISVIALGGLLGFLNYLFIGCSSGFCVISNNPYLSTIMGGFIGFVFMNRPCKTC